MIKAYMSGNLICPKCSYTMLNKSETVTCIMNMDCELFGKEFERPTVILHEIIEEPEECNHTIGYWHGLDGAIKVTAKNARNYDIADIFTYCPKCGEKVNR